MRTSKLKLLLTLLVVLFITPACKNSKKKQSAIATSSSRINQNQEKSMLDDDLEAFVIDDAPSFDIKNDIVFVDEDAENDLRIEQSREGFMPIYFEFDADAIKQGQSGVIEADIALAKKHILQGKKIVIQGHACKIGSSSEYNMHLSLKRAKAIYTHFANNGIPRDKMTIVGRGNEECVVQYGTKEQQSPNRRVEFVVIDIA